MASYTTQAFFSFNQQNPATHFAHNNKISSDITKYGLY